MKSRLLAGTAAIALAVVGALLIIFYAQGADQRAMQSLKPKSVLVVKTAIPAGTPVDAMAASLVTETLPATGVSTTALSTLADSAGTVASVDLVPGEQLLAERLVAPEDAKAGSAVEIPEGFLEVSFQVEPQKAVGGRLAAGDHIGIFMSLEKGGFKEKPDDETTQLTLRKVLVTSVQGAQTPTAEQPAEGAPAEPLAAELPAGSLLLTVAVSDTDANRIVFASEFGRLWLTKEPLNAKDNGPSIDRREVLYR
ncbi:MAG: flagellar biosynthesis protein FlgA [Pseudarthrobacter sp.]|nr:flagellar biosynthesis protein FlgA [Pseudarthrobacter sp.]